MNSVKKLGEILLDLGYITREQIDMALKFQSVTHDEGGDGGIKLGEFLLKQRAIKEEDLKEALTLQEQITQLGRRPKEGEHKAGRFLTPADPELFRIFPLSLAMKYRFFPVAYREDAINKTAYLALSSTSRSYLDELQFALGCFIVPIPTDKQKIAAYLQTAYPKDTKKQSSSLFVKLFQQWTAKRTAKAGGKIPPKKEGES